MAANKEPEKPAEVKLKPESAVCHRAQRDFKTWIRGSLVKLQRNEIVPEYLVADMKKLKCPIVEDRIVTI